MEEFAQLFGLDLKLLAVSVPIVIGLTNWLKTKTSLNGSWNLLPAAILSFLIALKYLPAWEMVAFSTFATWGLSVGMWDGAKILAHKAAEPKKK